MKKTGKSISMQPKKSSEQAGCSKEEEYERLMMEMKILLQEKYEEVESDEIKKQKMLQEELRGEVEEKVRELSQVQMSDELLLHHRATREEGDIEMKKLHRVLDALNLVLQSQMTSFEDVFSQKSEMEKVLDNTLKESQVMKSKIHDLELNSASILEKNLKLTKEIEKLTAEMKSPTTFEYSLMGSDNFSLPESSLDGSVKSVEHHLNWEEEEMVHNKDAVRSTISTLQKENEELQSKVAEVGKSYEEALEMMQRKLDLVIKEKEEKEMLMNERDLASNEKIEELRKEMKSSSEFQDAKLKAEEDEILEAFLQMTENLKTLHSENDKLKKDSNLGQKLLQNNDIRLKLMDWNRVRLEQELRTRNQEIDKLHKELKSLNASFEVGFGFQQEVCSST